MHRERVLKALAQLLVGVENKLHLADRRRRREDKLIERARLLEIQRAQNKTNLKDADANGKISYRIGAYMQMKKLEEVYTNRELSWLAFNERVLNEAANPKVPLAERLTFASIYQTNLDEFFMVRLASLKDQVHAGYHKTDIAGMTAKEQLKEISVRTHELVHVHKGNICYEENPSGGSIFIVTLPTDSSIYQSNDFLIPENAILNEESQNHHSLSALNEENADA